MPAYTVSLCRETLEFAEVEVEADSKRDAEEKALEIAKAPNSLYWEADDGNAREPYVNETLLNSEEQPT